MYWLIKKNKKIKSTCTENKLKKKKKKTYSIAMTIMFFLETFDHFDWVDTLLPLSFPQDKIDII